MEYLVSYRVINMDWCGLIIALVQKGRLETTSTFALWDKCTQSFFFRIEPIHIDHPVAGWYSAAHSWLDQQWQISFESHKRVSSLPLSPFSLGDPFLLEFLTLECLFPIGEAMEVWKHLDSPRKSHKKNQGSKSVEQQLPFTITVPSPDSSSNWIRCSLFFSCRLYILHFGYNTHMYHNIMLYASLNFSSFMIVLVVGGSNSKMWFPSFQSINFGKVVHTYYRSKEAVNLCRRSSFRGIIWWDFVRKKYPEIIKKRKEQIYVREHP